MRSYATHIVCIPLDLDEAIHSPRSTCTEKHSRQDYSAKNVLFQTTLDWGLVLFWSVLLYDWCIDSPQLF